MKTTIATVSLPTIAALLPVESVVADQLLIIANGNPFTAYTLFLVQKAAGVQFTPAQEASVEETLDFLMGQANLEDGTAAYCATIAAAEDACRVMVAA